jgi:tRNA A-37 threonylcarbamoyl transferase component Bud32
MALEETETLAVDSGETTMLVGQQIGPFAVEKELGSGAMGTVYRARHLQLNLRCALKVMAPTLTSAVALKRFKREAEILQRLKHPNIVRLVGIGKHHKSPFYAMEYVEGESLDRVIERRSRITWEELVELGTQLCAGLQHAHQNSVVHRDLKPSNVMVLSDGTVKLTDFGIAKDLSLDATQLTAMNCTVGTASYMSPEQCRGERDLSPKSDLYALGVMFFELVTGRKPFVADNVPDMFKLHESETPPRATRFVPDIPVELDRLIYHLMEKKPEQRPLNADAVAQALARIKEKVQTMQSAGVERAQARRGDRSSLQSALDETDKEIARTLLNKKKKKKHVPFFRKGWFQAVALSVMLAGVGYLFYWAFIKAPSAETLLAEARLGKEKDRASRRQARSGPIKQFLQLYPDDPRAPEMRELSDEIGLDDLDYSMRNRRGRAVAANDKAEEYFRLALDREDAGKLGEAAAAWNEILHYKNADDPDEEHLWHKLATQKDKDLEAVEGHYQSLRGIVRKEMAAAKDSGSKAAKPGEQSKSAKGESPEKDLALDALRSEELTGQGPEAREKWEELKARTRDDTARRRWHLLAAWRYRVNSSKTTK